MISILMSTHNPVEDYLKKCLDSIFNQTYSDFEIVLIDDNSDCDVYSFLVNNKYDLSKIKYKKIKNEMGLPKALNEGLKMCEGDYIARFDDDDIMYSDKLLKNIEFLEQNNLDGCWSLIEKIDKNDNFIGFNKIDRSINFLDQLLYKGNIFTHSTLFIKKECLENIGGYDVNLRFAQDSELYIRLLDKYKMGLIDEPLIKYRINDYRNNSYRETLSLTYALFGVVNYYTSNNTNTNKKSKIKLFIRILRYYYNILKIMKKNSFK